VPVQGWALPFTYFYVILHVTQEIKIQAPKKNILDVSYAKLFDVLPDNEFVKFRNV